MMCFRKKVAPPKTFQNIFTSVESLCVKFCKFVGSSYIHFNFCRFILMFHQIVQSQFFHDYPSFFSVKFCVSLFTHKNENAVVGLPLPGLRRTAEPVWSTRLQTFSTVLNLGTISQAYRESSQLLSSRLSLISQYLTFYVVTILSYISVLGLYNLCSWGCLPQDNIIREVIA